MQFLQNFRKYEIDSKNRGCKLMVTTLVLLLIVFYIVVTITLQKQKIKVIIIKKYKQKVLNLFITCLEHEIWNSYHV